MLLLLRQYVISPSVDAEDENADRDDWLVGEETEGDHEMRPSQTNPLHYPDEVCILNFNNNTLV